MATASQTLSLPQLMQKNVLRVSMLTKASAIPFTCVIMVIASQIKLVLRVFYSTLSCSFAIGQKMSRVQNNQLILLKDIWNVSGIVRRKASHGINGNVIQNAG